jgi:hypothetical protein
MTTLIITPDYFIADNRTTYSVVEQNSFTIKNEKLVIDSRETRCEQFKDNVIKIVLTKEDETFMLGTKRVVAWGFTGDYSIIDIVYKAINETKYLNDFNFLIAFLVGLSDTCRAELVFYFTNGNCFTLNMNTKTTKSFIDNYCLILGSGRTTVNNLALTVSEEKFHPRDLFTLAFISDKYTSHTYSVFGRKENMFYPLVDEGLDNIKQIGLTLRERYSTTFDPNNAS